MRRIVLNILIVAAVMALPVASIWVIHKTNHATMVYNRAHYGPAEVQGPTYRAAFTMDSPEALMHGRLMDLPVPKKNQKPRTKE